MAKFLMAYHGRPIPKTDDEIPYEMERCGDWMNSLGSQLIEPGARIGKSNTLSASGIADGGGANPVSGYSIVKVDSTEAALELIKACPHLDSGTKELAHLIDIPHYQYAINPGLVGLCWRGVLPD